jgi:serine/threonine protein kinase
VQANILVNEHGIAHLSDFGLASLTEWKNSSGLATTSQYGGTAKYKAPELFPSRSNRKPKPSKAGDIWALGCVLYEVGSERSYSVSAWITYLF